MAGNSKACFTALAFLENMEFFNVTPETISEWFMSKGASGVAVGLHYKEVDDKNHAHFLTGWSKSAPDTPGFVALLKEYNAEMIAKAKAEGKDVTIKLEDGSVVERQLFKIQTGRYAKKHCVYDPEAMELYLSHSTAQCKKDGKVEYDPDKDVIYTDGFDLDSYLSRDAVQKAKKAKEKDDVDLMMDIFEAINDTDITDIIDLAFYFRSTGRRDLLAYMHAHSSTITQALVGRRYRHDHQTVSYQEQQRCEQDFPHGTNSIDAGQHRPYQRDGEADPGMHIPADSPAVETSVQASEPAVQASESVPAQSSEPTVQASSASSVELSISSALENRADIAAHNYFGIKTPTSGNRATSSSEALLMGESSEFEFEEFDGADPFTD